MYHSDEVIWQLQDNKVLASQLDEAVGGVWDAMSDQVNKIGAGARRLLYYTSCFTDEYHDVCSKQRLEDTRFRKGIFRLIKDRNIIYEMLRIYFELIFRQSTSQQLEHIKRLLMLANVHISASSLTNQSFTLGITSAVVLGMKVSVHIRNRVSRTAGTAVAGLGIYGVVQGAADSAERLQVMHPSYYHALYIHELEMLYFLVESVFVRLNALTKKSLSDEEIVNIIARMAR